MVLVTYSRHTESLRGVHLGKLALRVHICLEHVPDRFKTTIATQTSASKLSLNHMIT